MKANVWKCVPLVCVCYITYFVIRIQSLWLGQKNPFCSTVEVWGALFPPVQLCPYEGCGEHLLKQENML